MRYLIISDIHGNFPALQTVLADARPFDAIWCLGDLVGYGPDPNDCIERIREFPHICIAGNHDWGAVGRADLYVFNNDARQALLWTRSILEPDNLRYLADLPAAVEVEEVEGVMLAHGSPREPLWEYLLDPGTARMNFMAFNFNLGLVGHTHIPLIFEWMEDQREARTLLPDWEGPLQLAGRRLILNPGSVGQPRDGNPRSSYAIYDSDTQVWEVHRVAYAVEVTQERMRARGLPPRLIDRLEMGR